MNYLTIAKDWVMDRVGERTSLDGVALIGVCGSIILFGSIYGILGQDINVYKNTPMKESVPYSLIKGGIINYVRQMAAYYGKYNIRVNCISPGGLQGHVKDSKNKQDKRL